MITDSQEMLFGGVDWSTLRGQFHTYSFSEHANPAQLMPTYHPAYLLRNYSDENRKRVWDDLQKVMAEMGLK
jgi:DNA polymerase